jgi:hypothetical protein
MCASFPRSATISPLNAKRQPLKPAGMNNAPAKKPMLDSVDEDFWFAQRQFFEYFKPRLETCRIVLLSGFDAFCMKVVDMLRAILPG